MCVCCRDRIRGERGGAQVWARDLAGGDKALVLFNSNGKSSATINVTWAEINGTAKSYHVRDLWARQDVGEMLGGVSASDVPPKDVKFYRISPVAN